MDTTIERFATRPRIVGALFLTATITYLAGSGLIGSILNEPAYLRHVYPNRTQVVNGVLLQFINVTAVAGIGILLFPILKKSNETIALGYAFARVCEALLLVITGIASLALIPLSQEYIQAGTPNTSSFQAIGTLLVAQGELAFQFSMVALALGSLPFCYLLYKSQLVPRSIAGLGLIGYMSLLIWGLLSVSGSSPGQILFAPGALFEIIFPIWIIVKGLNSPAMGSESAKSDLNEVQMSAAETEG